MSGTVAIVLENAKQKLQIFFQSKCTEILCFMSTSRKTVKRLGNDTKNKPTFDCKCSVHTHLSRCWLFMVVHFSIMAAS